MESSEIECGWDQSKLLAHLDFWEYQKSAARNKTTYFSFEYSCWSWKVSIQTLMQEIKHVVKEKHEFDIQDESIAIFLWTITFLMERFEKLMFQSQTLVKVGSFRLRPWSKSSR